MIDIKPSFTFQSPKITLSRNPNRGLSGKSYKSPLWEKIRRSVFRRDNYTCQFCWDYIPVGEGTEDRHLCCHHLVSAEWLPLEHWFNEANLITVCKECHRNYEHGKGRFYDPKDGGYTNNRIIWTNYEIVFDWNYEKMRMEWKWRNTSRKDKELKHLSFTGANLLGIDFSKCILEDVDLRGAILINANFSNACLTDVNLQGAILNGADFTNAVTENVNFKETATEKEKEGWKSLKNEMSKNRCGSS